MNIKLMFSSLTDNWKTPYSIYEKLNNEFCFDDDPCPLNGNDGLIKSWGINVFVNPPYSNIRNFLEKAMIELRKGSKVIVFLVPSRTDTKWWHEIVMPYAKEIRFIKGRLKFGNAKNSAPFPSCIIIFKNNP
jgi:phage N-6-adenine-methyltransferase